MSFWDVLRPSAPTKGNKGAATSPPAATAADLRVALAEAEAATADAEQAAAAIAQERGGMLLGADDAQLDEIDRRLQLAQRTADRAAAAVEALRERLADAEQRERQADLDKLFNDGQAALDRGLAIYKKYGVAAADLARLVAELPIVVAEIENANKLLTQRGDLRRVPDLDATARPHPPGTVRVHRTLLWERAVLPDHGHPYSFLWPVHTHVDVVEPVPQQPREPSEGPPAPPRRPGYAR